ncbi:hypothetical protein BY996DRAFT_6418106 [Phakopsora pachyrhizi]|nr:hypothetical protein BY996DRAFT_6418106 [Phakopsora pachyrhizi]
MPRSQIQRVIRGYKKTNRKTIELLQTFISRDSDSMDQLRSREGVRLLTDSVLPILKRILESISETISEQERSATTIRSSGQSQPSSSSSSSSKVLLIDELLKELAHPVKELNRSVKLLSCSKASLSEPEKGHKEKSKMTEKSNGKDEVDDDDCNRERFMMSMSRYKQLALGRRLVSMVEFFDQVLSMCASHQNRTGSLEELDKFLFYAQFIFYASNCDSSINWIVNWLTRSDLQVFQHKARLEVNLIEDAIERIECFVNGSSTTQIFMSLPHPPELFVPDLGDSDDPFEESIGSEKDDDEDEDREEDSDDSSNDSSNDEEDDDESSEDSDDVHDLFQAMFGENNMMGLEEFGTLIGFASQFNQDAHNSQDEDEAFFAQDGGDDDDDESENDDMMSRGRALNASEIRRARLGVEIFKFTRQMIDRVSRADRYRLSCLKDLSTDELRELGYYTCLVTKCIPGLAFGLTYYAHQVSKIKEVIKMLLRYLQNMTDVLKSSKMVVSNDLELNIGTIGGRADQNYDDLDWINCWNDQFRAVGESLLSLE